MTTDILLGIAFAIVFIGGPFWFLSKMDTRGGTSQKLSRILMRWAMILGISALVIYGAFWAMMHPDRPITLWFAIGVIILLALTRIKNLADWFGGLLNRGERLSTKSLDSSPTPTVLQIEDQESNSDGISNKTTIFEKIWKIVFGVSVVIFGAYWVSIYSNSPSWWCILGVAVCLVLALNLNWFSKPHKPSDPIYLELRALFRENLLPLNFHEEETYALGDHLEYTRGHSRLSMGTDIRDHMYYFTISNPDNSIYGSFSEGDQFKAEVIDKFEEWLAEQ